MKIVEELMMKTILIRQSSASFISHKQVRATAKVLPYLLDESIHVQAIDVEGGGRCWRETFPFSLSLAPRKSVFSSAIFIEPDLLPECTY
jgi:hypothetical protein